MNNPLINIKSQKPTYAEEVDMDMQFLEPNTDIEILCPQTETLVRDFLDKNNNRILVIESDEISALIIKELFNRKSIPISFVSNLNDGIIEIEKQPFNTIFLSLNDPINIENELFKITSVISNSVSTNLIGLTTNFTQKTINKTQKEVFNQLVLKPYNIKEIEKLFMKFQNSLSTKLPIKQLKKKRDYVFSLEQLKQVSNNNQEFIVKMLHKFLITALECGDVMTSPYSADYFEKAKKISHKSIPSYSIMGLDQLVNYLEYIEANCISEEKTNFLDEKIQLFVAGNKLLISDIQDYLK